MYTECAANCLKCDINGANLCDPGFCAPGYLNTAFATSCVGGYCAKVSFIHIRHSTFSVNSDIFCLSELCIVWPQSCSVCQQLSDVWREWRGQVWQVSDGIHSHRHTILRWYFPCFVAYTFLMDTVHCNTTMVQHVKQLVCVCVQRVLLSVVCVIALVRENVTLRASQVMVQTKQLGPALVSGH